MFDEAVEGSELEITVDDEMVRQGFQHYSVLLGFSRCDAAVTLGFVLIDVRRRRAASWRSLWMTRW